ncbi:MAG: NAD(P)/FAD-dependent oxidoreductase [Sphaerochaeta sp.]|jgi:predicted Rossmann fold flavoprotein|uniref:NAD(P)/FAD-dependent oxidoreductase n=1 Tax=Sphaerochaeta sp. TaxID=1972642 RepID=UPI002FCA72B9
MYDVLIVGSGAGGLFASANLRTHNALLLDQSPQPGKKLLITGSGMCNLTNTLSPKAFLAHFGGKDQRNFLLPALENFPPASLRKWFEQRGLALMIREDGKVFPSSQDARDVRTLLVREGKAELITDARVSAIVRNDEGFTITSTKGVFQARKILLATGGMSYPRTGSDGSGYALAKQLGHTIVPTRPALSAISIEAYPYRALAGNAVRSVFVEFFHQGEAKRYRSDIGDVLFTHDGLSGPVILTASREIQKHDVIKLTLVPASNRQAAHVEMEQILLSKQAKQVSTLLKQAGLFSALVQELLSQAGLADDITTSALNKHQRLDLTNRITNHSLTVASVKGFSSAMVTRGGVALQEVNRKTMESLIQPGLFVCGEILDYDGESGGFNLQAAFSTAYLACQSL